MPRCQLLVQHRHIEAEHRIGHKGQLGWGWKSGQPWRILGAGWTEDDELSLRDRAESLALRAILGWFRRMSPVGASDLGARLARRFGPWRRGHAIALDNLRRSMPELAEEDCQRIAMEAWENLGRVLAEMVHLSAIVQITESGPGVEIEGAEHARGLAEAGGPMLFFSGHLANWEVFLPYVNRHEWRMAGLFRSLNGPEATRMLSQLRFDAAGGEFPLFSKGTKGARDALGHLQQGGRLGMLVDQKLNEGIPVPLFGRDALTPSALAKYARKFRCPVVPVRAVRLGPARYRIIVEPPMELPASADLVADVRAVTVEVNRVVERWVRERPGEWLWMQRRWPRDATSPR